LIAAVLVFSHAAAQSNLKKVRIGASETLVDYLRSRSLTTRAFYKNYGIDLEIVLMARNRVEQVVD
jgi:hypothetical protein